MRILGFLLFLLPMSVWAEVNVQAAFDNGHFEQVIKQLAEPYQEGKLSIREQLLLAKAYRSLGRLQPALNIFHLLEKTHKLDNVYIQLAQTYLLMNGLIYNQEEQQVFLQSDYFMMFEETNIQNNSELAMGYLKKVKKYTPLVSIITTQYYLQKQQITSAWSEMNGLNSSDPNMQIKILLTKLEVYFQILELCKIALQKTQQKGLSDFQQLRDKLNAYKKDLEKYNNNIQNKSQKSGTQYGLIYSNLLKQQQDITLYIDEYRYIFNFLADYFALYNDTGSEIPKNKFKQYSRALKKYISNSKNMSQISYVTDYDIPNLIKKIDSVSQTKLVDILQSYQKIIQNKIISIHDNLSSSLEQTSNSYDKGYVMLLLSELYLNNSALNRAYHTALKSFEIAKLLNSDYLLSKSVYIISSIVTSQKSNSSTVVIQLQKLIESTINKVALNSPFYTDCSVDLELLNQTKNIEPEQVSQNTNIFGLSSFARHYKALFLLEWQLGKLYHKQQNGNAILSAQSYLKAICYLETSKNMTRHVPSIASEQIEKQFYDNLFELFLDELDKKQSILPKEILLKQIRTYIEDTKVADLQNYFKDDCITERHDNKKDIDAFLVDNPHTALIYTITVNENIYLLLNIGKETYLHELDKKISPGIDEFNNNIQLTLNGINLFNLQQKLYENRSLFYTAYNDFFAIQNADIKGITKNLYNLLITPLEPVLMEKKIDTLVIVPHSTLQTFPFSALLSPKTNRYLIEDYVIAISTGIKSTDFTDALDQNNIVTLLGGASKENSSLGAELGFNISALPYVEEELENIGRTLEVSNNDILFNENGLYIQNNKSQAFVKDNIMKRITSKPYMVLHLATHGKFDDDPNKTFIVTALEALRMNNLRKLVSATRYQPNPISLLTLSACQTAVGNEKAVFGLAGTAIKVGSRSVLATLWSVKDQETAYLVNSFYKFLSQYPTCSKAKALQAAQLHFLYQYKGDTSHQYNTISKYKITDFSHPFYWASFIIIGNWQ